LLEKRYFNLNYSFKKGILIYGTPGNGRG